MSELIDKIITRTHVYFTILLLIALLFSIVIHFAHECEVCESHDCKTEKIIIEGVAYDATTELIEIIKRYPDPAARDDAIRQRLRERLRD